MSTFSAAVNNATSAAVEIGEASAATIGLRMPLLMSMPFWPQHDVLLEAHRMIVEKIAAGVEGALEATREGAVLATRTAFGRTNPSDVLVGFVAIAMAAAKPTHLRARANAKRLANG